MSTFKLAAFFTSGAVLSNGSDPWGCCYNVGFGANMKECCQEPTQGGDVFLSSCRLQSRPGGATWFVNYQTCAWMEYNVWNYDGSGKIKYRRSWLKIDKPAVTLSLAASDYSFNPSGDSILLPGVHDPNPLGCCFNVGFGAGMFGSVPKDYCQEPTQGGDVRRSDCTLQYNGVGTATWFAESVTCEWLESNVWNKGFPSRGFVSTYSREQLGKLAIDYYNLITPLITDEASKQAAVHSEGVTGCCYSFRVSLTIAPSKIMCLASAGTLSMGGEPCCFKALLGNWSTESDCERQVLGSRNNGSSVRFAKGSSCYATQLVGASSWAKSSNELFQN